MVDFNRGLDGTFVNRARAALKAKIMRSQPRFTVIYDGSKQRGVLEVRQANQRREYPLPQAQQQTKTTEY